MSVKRKQQSTMRGYFSEVVYNAKTMANSHILFQILPDKLTQKYQIKG